MDKTYTKQVPSVCFRLKEAIINIDKETLKDLYDDLITSGTITPINLNEDIKINDSEKDYWDYLLIY